MNLQINTIEKQEKNVLNLEDFEKYLVSVMKRLAIKKGKARFKIEKHNREIVIYIILELKEQYLINSRVLKEAGIFEYQYWNNEIILYPAYYDPTHGEISDGMITGEIQARYRVKIEYRPLIDLLLKLNFQEAVYRAQRLVELREAFPDFYKDTQS